MSWTDFVSLSQKWQIRGRWSTLARVLSARTVGKRVKPTSLMHGSMFRGAGLVTRVIVLHLYTNFHIFGICRLRTIEAIFFIFEASRGGGEGMSDKLFLQEHAPYARGHYG